MQNTVKDGGPAFPVAFAREHPGMTLRDYFAAKAMQGIMAADGPDYTYHSDVTSAAKVAVRLADALLLELEATQPEATYPEHKEAQ